MLEPPRQDWELYERRCRQASTERLRSLSPSESLGIYEGLYRFASVMTVSRQERERRDRTRWREKLTVRRKMHAAFAALDRMRAGRNG